MNVLEEVIDYILDKLDDINVDNPKANAGAVYLKKNKRPEDIENLVYQSVQLIQRQFSKVTNESAAGEAKLTAVSSSIGSRFCIKQPELGIFYEWERDIRVGDLFVEAFYNCGFVDLYYPRMRNGFHMVLATKKWPLLEDIDMNAIAHNIRGSTTTKPTNIEGMMQRRVHDEEPLIKGRTDEDPININSTWVRAVNNLQQTGWKINNRVLDAMLKHDKDFISREEVKDNDAKEMKRRSKLIEWTFTMKKAQLLRNDVFYQYLQADYRGRLYYTEAFLNFQGSDIARGMLRFARGKPMDEHGLFWLAVHTACSYNQSYNIDEIPEWVTSDYTKFLKEEGLDSISVDKMTLEDRVTWTNKNMDWIRKSGEESIFYHEAEKSVSFLATCIEWADYHEALTTGQIYRTHLPIPIDGSNNGWQHLGAISKDPKTGILVGLIPVEIQQDFYVQTAKELYNLTDGRLREILDSMPMKHIRKGISKRGSMTRAYSAGAAKIGENMWFDCKAEDYHEKYGITEEDCMALAKLLVKAISIVCPGPLKTMGYLQALATAAIAEGQENLTWSTPSEFDVVYDCFYSKKCATKGTIAGYTKYNKAGRVNHVAQVYTDFPDVRGFMCGVSPNYIHSMDAAHMALVIDKWTGDFGAVHDSFSTHAPDVEHLLARTKREFIDMYDTPNYYTTIEDQLVEDMDEVTADRPILGSLQIEEIQDSDYFFA